MTSPRLLTIASSRFRADVDELRVERPDLDEGQAVVYVTKAWQALATEDVGEDYLPLNPPDWRACRAWIYRRWPSPASARQHVIASVGPEPPATPGPPGGLDRDEILAARRAWIEEGQKSTAIRKRLRVTDSTLIRARRYHGLVPWPKD
jgi:hypothetical protein